jgi:exosortase/archaeosortase family protein
MSAVPDTPGLTALHGRPARLGHGPARSVLRIAALTLLVAVAFLAGQTPYRHLEAVLVYGVLHAVGFHGVITVEGSQVLLQSHAGQLFWVDITPSCSSLGPALALALVATIMSVGNPTSDRLLAGVVGVASIIVGNLIRIGSSVVVGLLAGRVSLVLFHDWVGSTFGFAYTVGGFVLLLAILLRRRGRRRDGSPPILLRRLRRRGEGA